MNVSKNKVIALMVGAVLFAMLGLTACGNGASSSADVSAGSDHEAQSSASSESTAVSQAEPAAQTTSSDAASASADTSSPAAPSTDKAVAVSSFANAWMGASDLGETLYYAESADGLQGCLVVYNPETNEYVSFVGDTSVSDDNMVTITDIQSGLSITFGVKAADDGGNVVIDLGQQGMAALKACDVAEVVECFNVIGTYGDAIA